MGSWVKSLVVLPAVVFVPAGVDELVCDLSPYASCVNHGANAVGEAGDVAQCLRFFWENIK